MLRKLSLVGFVLLFGRATLGSDGPRTCIEDGCLQGKYFTGLTPTKRFEAYLGVPYAKPPVGELRFRNPQPVEPWIDDYDATFERNKCVQKNDLLPNAEVEGNEDCLYINVYKPQKSKVVGKPLAVMVYIHGGGYFAGSSSMGEFGPDRFMDNEEIVLVVMQYRLGVFGFLSTGDHAASGNFGLKDQNAVLKWVRKNIAQFGGDPELVTIVGQSAGGASVQMHMLSPLSKGLFSRAISMSGSTLAFWNWPDEYPLKLAQRQAIAVGIDSADTMSTEELVEAIRKINATDLGKSIDKLKFWNLYPLATYYPVVEKYVDNETFISEDPRILWASGEYHQVPWRTGFVPNEGAFASLAIITNTTLVDELNEHSSSYIPRMFGCAETEKSRRMLRERFFPDGTKDHWITEANVHRIQDLFSEAFITFPLLLGVKLHMKHVNINKNPVDVYYFSFKGNHSYSKYFSNTDRNFGVCHSDDLSYLFRSSEMFADFEPNSPEANISETLVEYFTRFVYDGVPSQTCQTTCNILEFTNSDNPSEPFKRNIIEGIDEEMIGFWTEIYNQ